MEKQKAIINMTDYIKCGEILKSSLPNYKYAFILKCYQCDQINLILESFITHIQEHCKEVPEIDNKISEDIEEESATIDNPLEVDSVMIEVTNPLVGIKDEAVEESINQNGAPDIVEEEDNKDEEFEYNSLHSDEEFQADDAETEDDEIQNKSRNKKKKSTLPPTIENFIKSKPNMKSLIQLYKNRPNLWNKELHSYRSKVTLKEVSEILAYIYQKQSVDFRRLRNYEENDKFSKGKNYKRSWFFDDLAFLRPKPVIQLQKLDSNMPDLTREQVIKIIQIYLQFPHLWNSNLIEFICSNKRHAAHIKMLKRIESDLVINISLTMLEQYIRTIHNYFSNEKRLRMKKNYSKSRNRADEYYEQLLYLYDHEGPFNCTECKRVLLKPLGYRFHKSNHDNSVPFICSQCNKDFKTINSYTVHAKRHFEDLEYACNICDKKFIDHGKLKTHLLIHTDDRPHFCEICGTSFRYAHSFKRHQRRHEKRYTHTCSICYKGYYTKDRYDDHMNSHLNIRPYGCKLCGKGFITCRALKTHAVTHEDARNHACKLCGKTFKLKIGVLQHMRTHGSRFQIDNNNTSKNN